MNRSVRITALVLAWLSPACFGNKVFQDQGGGGTGGTDGGAPSSGGGGERDGGGGSSAGGNADGGAGGAGGGPVSRCTPDVEGDPCDGGEPCGEFTCLASECMFQAFAPATTSLGDNGVDGDCLGSFCSGVSFESTVGASDDPPTSDLECFAGACNGPVPEDAPTPPGSACTTGVCSGTDQGCVQCISWANCTETQVCRLATNTCGNCQQASDCAAHPNGDNCEGGLCRCSGNSDCLNSPAGDRCNSVIGFSYCGCNTNDNCNGAGFGSFCVAATDECGCQIVDHCAQSALGHVCLMGKCGCNADADCSGTDVCDVTANVCVPLP